MFNTIMPASSYAGSVKPPLANCTLQTDHMAINSVNNTSLMG